VTAHIATVRGNAGANTVKITAGEMRQFIFPLRLELRIDLGCQLLRPCDAREGWQCGSACR